MKMGKKVIREEGKERELDLEIDIIEKKIIVQEGKVKINFN